ncbi:MAG: baseplate J/gp47 family protein, partial [Bryobacteraceae bacterium]
MPLPLPNLDDRTWSDLVVEGRELIPAWAPEWTDHNPSDPGITLVELFAFLSEMLIYRLNRISDENVGEFLKLISGPDWRLEGSLEEAKRATLTDLARVRRAVTANDFEVLALSVNEMADSVAESQVGRVQCFPGHNLPSEWEGGKESDTSADVSVVVLPALGGEPSSELLNRVRRILDRGRLLCARVHVLAPRYVTVRIRITLVLRHHFQAEPVHHEAVQALRRFYDPLTGGPDRRGWPFGRDVYVSEVYQLLAAVSGVDHVVRSTDLSTAESVDEISVTPAERQRVLLNHLHEV